MSVAEFLCTDFPFSTGCTETKLVGDIVKLGINAGPDYEIVAIAGNTAWVREPITYRNEALARLDHLRFVSRHVIRLAA